MTNCSEFNLDDLMEITAIPLSGIPAGDISSPANILAPTIQRSAFFPTLTGAIVIGQQAAVQGGALIPIKRNTGKAKDDESDAVSGRGHTVTVTCETITKSAPA